MLFSLRPRCAQTKRPTHRHVKLLLESLEDRTVPAKLFVGLPGSPVNATHFSNYNDAFEAAVLGDTIQMQPGTAIHSIGDGIEGVRTSGGQAGTLQMTVADLHLIEAGELVTISGGGGAEEIRLVVRTTRVSDVLTLLTFHQPLTFNHSGPPSATVTTLGAIGIDKALTIQGYAGTLAPITSNIEVLSGATGVTFRFVHFSGPDEMFLSRGSHQTAILNSVVTRVRGEEFDGVSQGNLLDGNLFTESVVMNNWENSRVTNNLFTRIGSSFTLEAVFASGVLIQGNTFNLSGDHNSAIRVVNSQGIQIFNNAIHITNGATSSWGIEVLSIPPSAPNLPTRLTEVTIKNNVIDTGGAGTGLHSWKLSGLGGQHTISAIGNDFHNNFIGIELLGDGATAGSVNLGFPLNPETPGVNNFRGFFADQTSFGRFAIIVYGAPLSPVLAQQNLWSVANPNTVIKINGAGSVDVGPTQLTADQQYVQTLFTNFLGRPATTTELNLWVGRLQPLGRLTVATKIARLSEAAGRLVDKTYQQFLGRQPDAASRARWVGALQIGGTVEQLISALLKTPEYFERVKSTFEDANSSFIQSLFINVRGRYATDAEVSAGVLALRQGKAGVIAAAVTSREFRQREVRQYFATFYHRTIDVSQAEIDVWANSLFNLRRIQIGFASSQFYYENG